MPRLTRAPGGCAVLATALAVASSLTACKRRHVSPASPVTSSSAHAGPSATIAEEAAPRGPLRFLVVGGGATPESTEVSLEQDVELVSKTLPGPGAVLFAGGTRSKSVRELDPSPRGDPVLAEVGDLFAPRPGRTSRYRSPKLEAGRATLDAVEVRLREEFAGGEGPFLLYVAAHGDQGSTAKENSIALWGGRSLTVARLAELADLSVRPFRLVATSCYSGGFAELAFNHADEKQGPSGRKRCGLFAGTADRQTSGCDANPDRRAQESYGLHFIHALSRTDRAGRPLEPGDVDFDHDGAVGLLDAHTRATIAAVSLDVPTTTSERWLRSVEKTSAPPDVALLPEAAAVVERLGAALGLRDEAAVEKRWAELEAELDDLSDDLDHANDDVDDASAELSAALLENWPVLDDPYHPAFSSTFAENHGAIAKMLDHSAEAERLAAARKVADAADDAMGEKEVLEARLLRLKRAWETLHLGSALLHESGPAKERFAELLACERGAP
ncbi:MAG TPA: hypothetical protein VHE30_15110 [Polyangiaceae bacterium]|nr:hypothetical protein [Polyangiaceae bacterium]